MKLRVGVVGAGYISQFHFEGIGAAGAEVAWICDVNEKNARPYLDKTGARFTTDFKQVCADPAVDVVFVLTTTPFHRPVCLAAIEAGKAVICEKTLGVSADEAVEILTAADQRGVLFFTSYMKRFIPAMARAKELLPSCGKILATHIRSYQVWGDCWNPAVTDAWFCQPQDGSVSKPKSMSGGGILIMGGSHMLDLVCFYLGRPTRVFGAWETMPGRDHDEHTSVLLETSHGRVHFDTLCHPFERIGYLRDGWDEQIEIIGDKGILHIYSATWNEGHLKPSLLVHHDRATGQSSEYRFAPVSPFSLAVQHYLAAIAKKSQGDYPRYSGYDVDELIGTISRSAAEHRAIEMKYRIG